MAKELYLVGAAIIGIFFMLGFSVYLGFAFLGTFLTYLLPVVGVIILGKGCTTYLAKKNL